jgi:hypothetical protein
MIAPARALELVRRSLREDVLGAVGEGDEHTRSILVAALGILGEVGRRVQADDGWSEPSVARLRAAAATWPGRLDERSGPAVAELIERSRQSADLRAERLLLMAAAEKIIAAYWSGERSAVAQDLRKEVMEMVEFDNRLEVELGARR